MAKGLRVFEGGMRTGFALACAVVLIAFACILVPGCSSKAPDSSPSDEGGTPMRPESNDTIDATTLEASTVPNEYAVFRTVIPGEDGKVRIPTEGIGQAVSLFNIDVEGTTVQVLALRDGYGKLHVAFNTCQSCTPSPKAYYTQIAGILQCTACGFTFKADEVGTATGGCNPWPIPGMTVTADEIVIPYASVAELKDAFARWEGAVA